MNTTQLKEIVSREIDQQWDAWAKEHPNLAAAIDRAVLLESTITRVRDEPEFIAAIRQADLDENALDFTGKINTLVHRVVATALVI